MDLNQGLARGILATGAALAALIGLEISGAPRDVAAAGWCLTAALGGWFAGSTCTAGTVSLLAVLRAILVESRDPWAGLTAALGAVALAVLSGQISAALRRERELARRDPLTHLPNRQALMEQLDAEIARSMRFQRPFTLVLVDCDGFKTLNDRHGHHAGDEMLQRLADAFRRSVRIYDLVSRLAGDEFVLILSEAARPEAESILERVWATVRLELSDDFPDVTFSAGAVTFPPGDLDPADCLQRVDSAMYSAKRGGKNRTVFREAPARSGKTSDFGLPVQ
jgi:diguanylate cyclase (GGDEF)-like protein